MDTKISFIPLKKAQTVFENFRRHLDTEQKKAGAVLAFEFCYELAWKSMKRILEQRGLEVGSPKDTFRKAFEEGLIDDPEVWFNFQQKRPLTAHIYDFENLDIIVDTFDSFSRELAAFIAKGESLAP